MSDTERAVSNRMTGSRPGGESLGSGDDVVSPSVLDALGDSACRAILREVNDPMSAQEIAEVTDLPLSSTYRKLDFLSSTVLLEETTDVRADGNHSSVYRPNFDAVRIVVDKRRNIDVSVAKSTDAGDD